MCYFLLCTQSARHEAASGMIRGQGIDSEQRSPYSPYWSAEGGRGYKEGRGGKEVGVRALQPDLQLASRLDSEELLGQGLNVWGVLQQLVQNEVQQALAVVAASAVHQLQQRLQLEPCTAPTET